MLSGHFLAHKPAFLSLLFNKDNFDFWLDSKSFLDFVAGGSYFAPVTNFHIFEKGKLIKYE